MLTCGPDKQLKGLEPRVHRWPTVSYCAAFMLLVLTGRVSAGICCVLSPDFLIFAARLKFVITEMALT